MDYQTKTHLILPFAGTLWVSNGGRDPLTNNHIRLAESGPACMVYAYDFRTENTGNEAKLEDFEVFGREVLAPADGEVIQVINGAIDVAPGERDRGVGVGNAIVIDHTNGEYSFLCHLKYNSIRVKVGEIVKQGEVIALCGNTGNTSQPHIHYHLQDNPHMYKANGLPAQFAQILVEGEEKQNYEPIGGQHVSNLELSEKNPA